MVSKPVDGVEISTPSAQLDTMAAKRRGGNPRAGARCGWRRSGCPAG